MNAVPAPTTIERQLRLILAMRLGSSQLYLDDGEIQDGGAHPFIDWLRDSPAELSQKLIERARPPVAIHVTGNSAAVYAGMTDIERQRIDDQLSRTVDALARNRERRQSTVAVDVDRRAGDRRKEGR